MASLILLIIFALLAILVPMLATRRWDQVDLFATYQRPSLDLLVWHRCLGRDISADLVWQQPVAHGGADGVVLAQMLIGVLIGCFSGLSGGRVDAVAIMRFVDIMIAIPFWIWVNAFSCWCCSPAWVRSSSPSP